MTYSRRTRGLARANVATLFFGLAGVLGAISGLPAPLITLGRVIFASAALGFWAVVTRPSLRPHSRRDAALLIALGLTLALHWTLFFQAIIVANVAVGLLAFSSFPLFTVIFEPLLLHQRPQRTELIAAALILPGVYLLVPRFALDDHITQGVLWGLLGAATFAVLSVLDRGLTRRYASVTISLWQDGVAAIALLPTLAIIPVRGGLNLRVLAALVALGVICTALAHTLFIASLRDLTAQLASVIAALEPVWGVAFAWLLLSQVPNMRTVVGGMVIVAATLLPVLASQATARHKPLPAPERHEP